MTRLRPSGGYRESCSFQTATVIYDATHWFCEAFLDPRSRMADQMVQAARSGRQNIAEGSRAAVASSQTELRLVNVARSSLEELLLDYEDYLRHRHLPQWHPDSAEARAVRDVPRLFRERNAARGERAGRADPSDRTDRTDPSRRIPSCPACGKAMVLRTAKAGRAAGRQFWGCSSYPECKGAVPV